MEMGCEVFRDGPVMMNDGIATNRVGYPPVVWPDKSA